MIVFHVGNYPSFSDETVAVLRLSGRWAVPFFFMVTGLFLGAKDSPHRAVAPIARLMLVFVAASLAMLPLSLWQFGVQRTFTYCVDPSFLLRGTYFHLWFIGSLLLALLVVLMSDHLRFKTLLPSCAIGFFVLNLALDSYNAVSSEGMPVARQLSGLTFLYIGMVLGRYRLEIRWPLLLVVAGLGLQILEAAGLRHLIGKSILEHQTLLGTLVLSLGVLGLAQRANLKQLQSVAALGRDYSLLIYIIHPYLVGPSNRVLALLHASQRLTDLAIVPATFLSSLVVAILIKRYFSLGYALLNGDHQAFLQIDELKARFGKRMLKPMPDLVRQRSPAAAARGIAGKTAGPSSID